MRNKLNPIAIEIESMFFRSTFSMFKIESAPIFVATALKNANIIITANNKNSFLSS